MAWFQISLDLLAPLRNRINTCAFFKDLLQKTLSYLFGTTSYYFKYIIVHHTIFCRRMINNDNEIESIKRCSLMSWGLASGPLAATNLNDRLVLSVNVDLNIIVVLCNFSIFTVFADIWTDTHNVFAYFKVHRSSHV